MALDGLDFHSTGLAPTTCPGSSSSLTTPRHAQGPAISQRAAPPPKHRGLDVPFQGDEVLSVILSKVLSSAADDKITDLAILLQLERWA
jgi:hypothetical protein